MLHGEVSLENTEQRCSIQSKVGMCRRSLAIIQAHASESDLLTAYFLRT